MDGKNTYCCFCKYFDRYYTKEVIDFKPTKFGWCCNGGKPTEAHGGCEDFVTKPRPRKVNRLLTLTLNDLLTQISAVRKIVEETDEENKLP